MDFHKMRSQEPIEIKAILTELPAALITEDKFGLCVGFWNPSDGMVYKEQVNDSFQMALKLSLRLDQDLEPQWTVLSLQDNTALPQRISSSDRRLLGAAKIGNYVESDLSWSRTSALTRLTEKDDLSQIPALLADSERKLLNELESLDLSIFSAVIENAAQEARKLGINAQEKFRAGMDPARIALRQGAIALFDGVVPLSLRGSGSRRLMAMALHKASTKDGAVLLIDEIENGLEPYHLRHLIRHLLPKDSDLHQVIFTTHSPTTLVECSSAHLCVVRSSNGVTTVKQVGNNLQKMVRSIPEAFLAKKIILCEGKTEAGLCRGLDIGYWQSRQGPLAASGVVPIESPGRGGSEAPKDAVALAKLGYETVYFGDSDRKKDLKPSVEEMEAAGCKVILAKYRTVTLFFPA